MTTVIDNAVPSSSDHYIKKELSKSMKFKMVHKVLTFQKRNQSMIFIVKNNQKLFRSQMLRLTVLTIMMQL